MTYKTKSFRVLVLFTVHNKNKEILSQWALQEEFLRATRCFLGWRCSSDWWAWPIYPAAGRNLESSFYLRQANWFLFKEQNIFSSPLWFRFKAVTMPFSRAHSHALVMGVTVVIINNGARTWKLPTNCVRKWMCSTGEAYLCSMCLCARQRICALWTEPQLSPVKSICSLHNFGSKCPIVLHCIWVMAYQFSQIWWIFSEN